MAEEFTKAEQDYIEERTRQLLAHVWADLQIKGLDPVTVAEAQVGFKPYVDFALSKKWLSLKNDKYKVLALGFATAAAYLRR